ncbi:aldehyde dehydrogenase [Delitschia confertaspora ATCC 74209]|uniref:Aldehyde dehydrogenase n=1 Tax=Delitschia confertaspora ATCC 74209 TaxID=1513339 RepID=A0A9P4MLJ0_9PLEO|nr:aldehyde dehydrogenase [Delitschia confertaspora ATCC 74209]
MPSSEGTRGSDGTTYTVPLWLNGIEESRSDTFDVISPSTNSPCWTAAIANASDAISAVESAASAFKIWSLSKPAARATILLKAADIMEANAAEYAGYMATEMGAEARVAQFFILPLAIQMLRDIAGRIASVVGSVPVVAQEGQSAMVWKEPYGVILGIVPWNAPYVFGVRSAATAIATGNTTVLKASELTPRCYWAVGKAFHEAGLPAGVLNIIACPPSDAAEIVTTMIGHPAIRKINFTGSAETGRKVARACGQNLKPCLMELGGKNSAIVLEDADLEKAVEACIAGSFLNAGQICMGTDRIIVQSAIAPKFLEIIKERLAGAASGPQSLPQVVNMASKTRLDNILADAVEKGAQIIFPGNVNGSPPGTAFIPTVVGNVQIGSKLWEEECFGPMVNYVIVESEAEAVKIANETGYGLSAAVFTHDLRKGFRIARMLESGAVHINSMTIHDEPVLPFGGVKNSGWGRFNAEQGMEEFLTTKSVTWDD